ncbi:MAG: ATP-binding protein [Verrucomicrobiota bacterium]
MNPFRWQTLKKLPEILTVSSVPDLALQEERIRHVERNIGLPVKAAVIVVLFYYLFFSKWFEDVTGGREIVADTPPREMVLETIRWFFLIYVVISVGMASMLLGMSQLPFAWVQQVVFTSAWLDALFLFALTVATGGFDSILYWVFLALIVRNATSTPLAARQITLNVIVCLCYVLSGLADVVINNWQAEMLDEKTVMAIEEGPPDSATEPFVLRLSLLFLMTACCYGVQVLLEKQRRAEAEAREFALRQEQLQATGRLAAEIAHQLKNPLGIINNAAFTLQRTVKEGKTITQQIRIIREEVDRSDRIITELMGYARLTEGKVERLNVTEELDRAIEQVFPPAAKYEVQIHRDYGPALPPLLLQRAHLSEVFVNLLQNAREAMDGRGNIHISAHYGDNYSVVVKIGDDGPGIPPEAMPKIFEPYFTTKEKGTGLGLAIVKHNTELYNGTVQVESDPGKGTCFTVVLPAKTLMKIRK